MTPYQAPLDHIRFVFEHLLDAASLEALPGYEHADLDTMFGLLEEFARFCVEVIAPLNQVGDVEGTRFDPATGRVTTAPGWKEAYEKYVAAGWGSVAADPVHGGGGFPRLLAAAMNEILAASNMAFALAPMLTQSGIELIGQYGNDPQRERYVPRLVTGEWTGTMNMTEPHAGSDVGALTTTATPNADGSWSISGMKIFITYGEHDLTENIVHLVLARVPGTPAGTRGISCFVVPKVLLDGRANSVRCVGIERKMGIHGSPTCTMLFDGAHAELVGAEPNRGMAQMFTMMNAARFVVGISGLAVADRAYQAAELYARERRQGRAAQAPPGTSSPIIDHPDVQRMLLHVRSHVEAARTLAYTNAQALDVAQRGRSDEERLRARELGELLTPITKAWSTDLGSELTRICTQVHGGAGYVTETGVEQFERDVRIASLYEGTNGIQAIDLVRRKLPMRSGAVMRELLDALDATAEGFASPWREQMRDASCRAPRASTAWLLERVEDEPADVLAGATPYLRQFGTMLGGFHLARQAAVASVAPDAVASARFFCEQVLPQSRALLPAVTAGAEALDGDRVRVDL